MLSRVFAATLVSTVWIAGCGSDDSGAAAAKPPLEVTGTIAGIAAPETDSAGVVVTLPPNTSGVNESSEPYTVMLIAMADRMNLCDATSGLANATAMSFILGMKGNAIVPGKYSIGGDSKKGETSLLGGFATTDASCKASVAKPAITGTLTVDSVNSSEVVGSFDVVFLEGAAKGSFKTSLCFTAESFTKLTQGCGDGG